MQRQSALIISIVCLIIFALIAYYGAQVTLWSSIIFALFAGLILLVLLYPPSQATTDEADYSLAVYACYIIIGMILLAVYIGQKTLSDVREI